MRTQRTLGISGALLALSICLLPAADRTREQEYQQAVDLFESKGDVKSAIKLFEDVARSPDRNLAARSLLYLGSCYEKLGQEGAQKAYRRLVQDFSDQSDVTAKARARLAALGKPGDGGVEARRIWASHPSDNVTYGSLVSADGRYLSFLDYGNDSINIKDTVTGEERQVLRKLSPTDRTFNWVNVSPDGKKLGYCSSTRFESYQLFIVGVDGSNPRHFGEGCPEDWSRDGKYLLANHRPGRQLDLIAVTDGSSRPVASGTDHARLSPDGRYMAFVLPEAGRFIGSVVLAPTAGGPKIVAVEGRNKDVLWSPDGKSLLFVSDRRGSDDLWSIRIADGKPDGPPEMVREHISSLLGISRTGDLYYESGHTTSDVYTVDIDPETGKLTSRPKRVTTQYINRAPAWSPDGESLVYYSQRGARTWGEAGLTVVVRTMATDAERTVPLKRTVFLGPYHPHWFPDGRSLFAQIFRPGNLIRIDLQTGEDRLVGNFPLVPAPIGIQTAALASDGRSVYYLARDQSSDATRVLVRNLDDNGERELFRSKHVGVPALSADGSHFAFLSDSERGGWAVFTLPARGGQPTELYRNEDRALMPVYRYPVWSKDGKHIFVATAPPKGESNGDILSIAVNGGDAHPLGVAMNGLADLDLHPDGKRLAFTNSEWRDEIWVLKNLVSAAR